MATYIQGIQTSVGVVKYDYNYLANLPEWNLTERFGYGFAHTVSKIISLPYRVEKKITKIVKKSQ